MTRHPMRKHICQAEPSPSQLDEPSRCCIPMILAAHYRESRATSRHHGRLYSSCDSSRDSQRNMSAPSTTDSRTLVYAAIPKDLPKAMSRGKCCNLRRISRRMPTVYHGPNTNVGILVCQLYAYQLCADVNDQGTVRCHRCFPGFW
jgi:hypothetical protein